MDADRKEEQEREIDSGLEERQVKVARPEEERDDNGGGRIKRQDREVCV
jgi:hypothetical protein